MISMLSLFECITRSLSDPLEDIKLIAIANWIFHVSDVLGLFAMSFKYGLISSRYYLIDGVLVLSSLLSYLILLLLENLPTFTGL